MKPALVLSLALVAALPLACARPQPLPQLVAPAVVPRADPLPEIGVSTLRIPVGMPIADLQQLLREHLTLPNLDDYQVVSDAGQSPEVAIRYAAELLPPELSSEGDVLHVQVPIAYYGSFRARAKTPFGWVWLTKGTHWGTPEAQGRIDVSLDVRVGVGGDWTLSSASELRALRFTAPPVEKVCTGGLFKVCVPAEWVAERVHQELDRRVRERVERGLAEVDAQARERVNLSGLASQVWARLQAAQSMAGMGEALYVAPEQLGISPPEVRADALVSDLRVWCRPGFAPPAQSALPAPAGAEWPGDHVEWLSVATLEALQAEFRAAGASGPRLPTGQRVTGFSLLGTASEPGRWLLGIALVDDAERNFTLYGAATLHAEGTALHVDDLLLLPESERLATTAKLRSRDLAESVARAVRVELQPVLDVHVGALRSALSGAISPWPTYPLAEARVQLVGVFAVAGGMALHLRME
ncbi:MAG: hypothetical protein RL385_4720 [Pseudomonadota bacterium]